MKLDVYGKSVEGTMHPYEDRILIDKTRNLYAVADGVTQPSQGSGAVGAELALKLLIENFSENIGLTVEKTHQKFLQRKKMDYTVGETTLTAALIRDNRVNIANVGDTPAYLIRGDNILKLYHKDVHPEMIYITQVIGYPENILVNRNKTILKKDDYLILASDGTKHALTAPNVFELTKDSVRAEEFVELTIERAQKYNFTGYDDDKSLIVIKVLTL